MPPDEQLDHSVTSFHVGAQAELVLLPVKMVTLAQLFVHFELLGALLACCTFPGYE